MADYVKPCKFLKFDEDAAPWCDSHEWCNRTICSSDLFGTYVRVGANVKKLVQSLV